MYQTNSVPGLRLCRTVFVCRVLTYCFFIRGDEDKLGGGDFTNRSKKALVCVFPKHIVNCGRDLMERQINFSSAHRKDFLTYNANRRD